MTIFDDTFWWQFLMTTFDDIFWWHFLMTIFNDNFWKFLLTNLTIFDKFYHFWQFWIFSAIFDILWKFWTILINFGQFWWLRQSFAKWKDSPGDSTFETLSTILTIENLNSVNHSYLTINCDTGQHSQFLRCFITRDVKKVTPKMYVHGTNVYKAALFFCVLLLIGAQKNVLILFCLF